MAVSALGSRTIVVSPMSVKKVVAFVHFYMF
jgi:hypothetical protein